MNRVSAILLAAGESRRMGDINKLSLPVNGQALLYRTVQTLLNSNVQELVVVLGHEAEAAQCLLHDLNVRTVYNRNYTEGQMTSVHCGLAALNEACEGVMICLTDQPLLTTQDINHLIDAFLMRETGSIVVPTYQNQRGNPIILSYTHREEILSGGRNLGCKRLIERNPELVIKIEMDNDHWVFDLDTPNDYALLQQRLIEDIQ